MLSLQLTVVVAFIISCTYCTVLLFFVPVLRIHKQITKKTASRWFIIFSDNLRRRQWEVQQAVWANQWMLTAWFWKQTGHYTYTHTAKCRYTQSISSFILQWWYGQHITFVNISTHLIKVMPVNIFQRPAQHQATACAQASMNDVPNSTRQPSLQWLAFWLALILYCFSLYL